MKVLSIISSVLLTLIASTTFAQQSEAIKEKARDILSQHGDSIVKIRARADSKRQGMGLPIPLPPEMMSHSTETSAVVVDQDGLFVVPYSSLDANVGGEVPIQMLIEGGEVEEITVKSEFKSIDVILSDGSSVSGEIVLIDRKLDLAVVGTKKPVTDEIREKLVATKFVDRSKQIETLDTLVTLNRYSETFNWQVGVGLTSVNTIIEQPRLSFVAKGTEAGGIVFDLNGNCVGIVALKRNDSAALDFQPMMKMATIVLPSKYILPVIEKARAKRSGSQASPSSSKDN